MNTLTIGKLGKLAGVGVETIRFYEREGLLPVPTRKQSGYRIYAPDAVRRLAFIRQAKNLGFELKEIAQLLSLRVDDKNTCLHVRTQIAEKINLIYRKIAQLGDIKTALEKILIECGHTKTGSACPLLDHLDDDRELT